MFYGYTVGFSGVGQEAPFTAQVFYAVPDEGVGFSGSYILQARFVV